VEWPVKRRAAVGGAGLERRLVCGRFELVCTAQRLGGTVSRKHEVAWARRVSQRVVTLPATPSLLIRYTPIAFTAYAVTNIRKARPFYPGGLGFNVAR